MNVNPMSPMTTVILCANVPLDNTYSDTLTFATAQAQENFFKGKGIFPFPNLGPVRMQNAIRIPKNADLLYQCNYLMFQNANFGNKWFYAFITSIDFVNVDMSTVSFEIDVMQTWMFNYTLKECFVEREHIKVDTFGANLVPEDLELGEYILKDFNATGLVNQDWKIVVAATVNKNTEDQYGTMYSGIYSGLRYNVYNADDPYAVSSFLEAVTVAGKSDAIVSIFMMPGAFADENTSYSPKKLTVLAPGNLDAIDEYVPKNKKLFTYPYNFLYVTNNEGNEASYRYEYFAKPNSCDFVLSGDMSANPQCFLYPKAYKGLAENPNEKITLSGFPQCAWTSNSYQAWLAQTGSSQNVAMMSSAVALGGGIMTGQYGLAFGGLVGIASTMAKREDHSKLPPQAHGTAGSSLNFASQLKDFYIGHMYISKQFAQRIDDFWTMFGYATNAVKVPNVTGRPSWNYVKTIDCKITGSVPFDDMAKIKSNFNNGITFWHGDWVGDYSRNNQPAGKE